MRKHKKSQITIFLILGIVVTLAFAIIYFMSSLSNQSKQSAAAAKTIKSNKDAVQIVKNYMQSCLDGSTEKSIFAAGAQGNYLNLDAKQDIQKTFYAKNPVPYYLEATCESYCQQNDANDESECKQKICKWAYKKNMPDLDLIKKELENNILAEFEECFSKNNFANLGIDVIMPEKSKISISASINKEDVSVSLAYPLAIKSGEIKANMDLFTSKVLVRLKALYDAANELISKISSIQESEYKAKQENEKPYLDYAITKDECSNYDKNGKTNLYTLDDDAKTDRVVRLMDYSNFYSRYSKTYGLYFALKNINIRGACSG